MNLLHRHSVKFNYIMRIILKLSGALCSVISYPIALRAIGANGMGKVAFAFSVTNFFAMLATLGIPTYGIRECARIKDDSEALKKTVRELLLLQHIITGVTVILFFICVLLIPRLRNEWQIYLILGISLLSCAFETEWFYEGMEQYGYLTVVSVISKVLSVILIVIAVHSPNDYLQYASIHVWSSIAISIVGILLVRNFIQPQQKIELLEVRKHIRPAMVFFAQTAAITVYTNMDSAMLGFLSNDYWVGIYDSSIKIKMLLSLAISSVGTVLFPRFSYYAYKGKREEYSDGVAKTTAFILIISISMAYFFAVMSSEFICVLFGNEFSVGTDAMRVLMLTIPLIGISTVTGTLILVPTGRERVAMYSYIAGAIIDFTLNLILIPRYNALGAALGTLAAECTVLLIQIAYLHNILRAQFSKMKVGTIFISVLLPGIALLLIKNIALPYEWMKLALGGISYFALVLLSLMLLKEPITISFLNNVRKPFKRV